MKNSASFFGVAGIALGLGLGSVLPEWSNDAGAPMASLAQTVDAEGAATVREKDLTAPPKSMGRGNAEEAKAVSPVSFRTPGARPGLETGAAPHNRVRYASPTAVIPEAVSEAAPPPAKVIRAKSSRHAAASAAVPTPVRKETLPKAGSNRTTIAAAVVPVPTVGLQERSSTSRNGKGKNGKLTNAEAEIAAAASILAAAQLR